jgi:hypothetical protein
MERGEEERSNGDANGRECRERVIGGWSGEVVRRKVPTTNNLSHIPFIRAQQAGTRYQERERKCGDMMSGHKDAPCVLNCFVLSVND